MSLPPSSSAKFIINRSTVLKLFRQILKTGESMPNQNRRDFVRFKARQEFDRVKNISDKTQQQQEMLLGEVHLETLQIQSKHLSKLVEFEPREPFARKKA
mmetsp:Transcript_11262/g.18870  ORF Transcript_11262/g.18870 Transcript_11262/m.18870 type:complete len:100 (-) Transcript_11262:41-340(-)